MKPGENVTLRIQTNPGSLVGLIAVDERIADTDSYLQREEILDQLSRFTHPSRMKARDPGKKMGLLLMTNAHYSNIGIIHLFLTL